MLFFVKKSLIFLLSSFVFMLAYLFAFYHENDVKNIWGYEVLHSITKSLQKKEDVTVLILGDSVGKQMYDNLSYNDGIYSLACNQAISLAGQFILLNNFLSSCENKEKLDVVLIYRPSSFANNLDQKFTFHYFVKPFFNDKYKSLMTKLTVSQIQKIPFYSWSQFSLIKESNWSPNFPNPKVHFDISETSIEYLVKMDSVCNHFGVNSFKLHCAPLSEVVSKEEVDYFKDRIIESGLTKQFGVYFDKLLILDKEDFNVDQIHLLPSKIPENYLELMD